MRIYIIGASGSGKTTLARKLSEKYHIEYFELDLLVYDDEKGHVKRSDEEINNMFDNILVNRDWIIEDVGRNKFLKGRELCDKIYYIKLSKIVVIWRVIKRWFKQKFGIEKYNYPPTLLQLFDMLKITFSYFEKEDEKIKSLELYKDKVVFLKNRDLMRLGMK